MGTACIFRNSRNCSALYLHMMDNVGKHQLKKQGLKTLLSVWQWVTVGRRVGGGELRKHCLKLRKCIKQLSFGSRAKIDKIWGTGTTFCEACFPKGPSSCHAPDGVLRQPSKGGNRGRCRHSIFRPHCSLNSRTANPDENVFSDTLFHSLCYFKIGI